MASIELSLTEEQRALRAGVLEICKRYPGEYWRDLDTAMILAIEAYNATVVTEDRLEGVRAFNEKRTPEFKGK